MHYESISVEDLKVQILSLQENTQRTPLEILKEKIFHIELFLKQREEYTQKMLRELTLCKELLKEYLKP